MSRRSGRSSTSACIRTVWCTCRRWRNKFVKDPHEVVKAGQIVKVKVLAVDVQRQRISLTMRIDDAPGSALAPNRVPVEESAGATGEPRERRPPGPQRAPERQPQPGGTMAMAMALARAKQKK